VTNILVFPCGSEIALEIHGALKYAKGIRLVGASSVADHGRFVFRDYEQIEAYVGDDTFLDEIRRLVRVWQIDLIYPAMDVLIEALAGLGPDELSGAEVVGSSAEANLITRYKSRTYEALSAYDFVPATYTLASVEPSDFPIFLKPDGGYGSRGIAVAVDRADLERRLAADPELIAVELLPGREFTVDCFSDRHRRLLFTGPRVRSRVKSGISVSSTTVELTDEIRRIAEAINETIELRGQWFFQVKESADGQLKLLEIGPRVAGTMNLYRSRGVNFPLLTVLDRLGFDVEVIDNGFEASVDRALVNRHILDFEYEAVYVDFDDTLIVDDEVNGVLVAYLHQAKAAGKTIVLLTRHADDLDASLERHAISPKLFDRVVHITDGSPKSQFIDRADSVFIDDSYRERVDVRRSAGAKVFDVDAVESLLDWRR
jgi:hypothetical protein